MDENFFQTQSLQATIEHLGSLSEQQFENLLKAIDEEGFDRSISRCNKLARQLNSALSPREAFSLLRVVEGLYDDLREWRSVGDPLIEILEFAGVTDGQGKETIQTGFRRLQELIVVKPNVETLNKVSWLETGIIDTVVDISSFVDLRPNFSDDRSRIEDLLPIVIFRVLTASDARTHNSFVFQLTRDDITKIRTVLIDTEKKLDALEADDRLRLFQKPTQGEDQEASN